MKTIYSIILLFVFSSALWGQKIDKKYLQVYGEQGNLYFIKAQKLNRMKSDIPKDLVYDITYLDSRDSASFTCTVFLPTRSKLTTVCLEDGDNSFQYFPELLYAKKKKSYWEYRVRWNIAYFDLKKNYQSENPYSLSFTDEWQKTYPYSLKKNKWEKQRSIVLSILDVIELNRGE